MFTGIVESMGTITGTRVVPGGREMSIDAASVQDQVMPGASLSVSGVCLTVSKVAGRTLVFDVVTETLRRTNLGSKRVGDRVNLERSLRPLDRLDGHFVQGHVDGTAEVERVIAQPEAHVVWLRPEPQLLSFIIPKGSVAVDGVSLTLVEVKRDSFSVALIPTTLERTTLSDLRAGRRVNLETDILARTVIHGLTRMSQRGGLLVGGPRTGLTREALHEAGLT